MPDNRRYAVARMEIYPELNADPVVLERGFSNVDIVAKSYRRSEIGWNNDTTTGQPYVEFIKGIGLVARAFFTPQDTWLSDYVASFTWEEQTPDSGEYRVKRLVQYDNTPGVNATLISSFLLDADPHFAFSVIKPDTAEGWDSATYGAPRVRFLFGDLQWCIQYDQRGVFVMRWSEAAADYLVVDRVSASAVRESEEVVIWVRCSRGKIAVSTNMGESYSVTESQNPDEYYHIPASNFRFQARGGAVSFGLHSLAMVDNGFFDSLPKDYAACRRATPPTVTMTKRSDEPSGTSITLTDISDTVLQISRWRAVFHVAQRPGPGGRYHFYNTPALYSVTYGFPVIATVPDGAPVRDYDKWILSVTVDKPYKLDASTCTVHIHLDAKGPLFAGNFRWRKVRIWLGWRNYDDSVEVTNVFTGYIRKRRITWDKSFRQAVLQLTIDNVSIHFKRAKWTHMDTIALGGNSPNAIGDYTLGTEGLGPSYRDWSPLNGANVALPAGLPEKPFELTRVNEEKWKTMTRCFGYRDLELGVTDDGLYFTTPAAFITNTVLKEFTSTEADDIRKQIDSVASDIDYSQMGTAVFCYGLDEYGNSVITYAMDDAAETDVSSGRSCPWREVVQEEQRDAVKSSVLFSRTAALARETFSWKSRPDLSTPVDLSVGRRAKVTVQGCEGAGIEDGTEFRIMSVRHEFRAQGSLSSLKTNYGIEVPF